MNQILCCDQLPERARWCHLAHTGLLAVPHKKMVDFFHIVNLILTKLVWSRSLYIGLALFCKFIDRDSVLVHKQAKENLANILPLCQEYFIFWCALAYNK